jgi:hypothetical protein
VPQLPDWFGPIGQQFPIVVFVFLAAWAVVRWTDRRHKAELAREEAKTDVALKRAAAEIVRVRQDKDAATRAHEAELNRVTELLNGEISRLRTRITRLENRLDGGREAEET